MEGLCYWEAENEDGDTVRRQRGYYIDDAAIARVLLAPLPPALADLLDVALAAYTIDRLSPRQRPGRRTTDRGWQRALSVHVPVRDLTRWNQALVWLGLEGLLSYFTDDRWTFTFSVARSDPRTSEVQSALFALPFGRDLAVCLFSGGLDSLAGAVRLLLQDAECHLICIGGATNDWLGQTMRELLAALARRFGERVTPLIVPFHLASPDGADLPEETTQRSRAFLYLILGAVTALLARTSSLIVHENGVGALNLPYNGAQFGTHLTRAMCPLALADTANWLSTYLGRPFRIVSSALGLTKAGACRPLTEAGLRHLVSATFSCDGFQRRAGQPRCGVCTSCLLRRQSLYASGLAQFDNAGRYRFDVTAPANTVPERHRTWLRLMLDQRHVLRQCVLAADPWRALVDVFPSLLELEARTADWQAIGGPDRPATTIPKLYRGYVQEWEQFPIDPSWGCGSGLTSAA